MNTISAKQIADRVAKGEIELIDVRTPAEYRESHASGAKNIPLDTLDPKAIMSARNGHSDQPLYVMCKSGMRGGKACEKFIAAGYPQVVNVEGGIQAWEAANLPVIRGKKTISLERQVRIAAGFLVLIGALLGFFVSSYFFALCAFVGAGLMYAGITDTCGMGMMLAKMPWNQVKNSDGGSCAA